MTDRGVLVVRVGALTLAALALLDFARTWSTRAELQLDVDLVERQPGLQLALQREDDRAHAVLLWARFGVEDALDLSRLAGLEEEAAGREAQMVADRLRLIESRAGAIASRAPWRGDAWLALGTAEFLRRWREEGPSAEARERWRVLLGRAVELSGGDPDPRRILALAWLAEWSVVPEDERAEGREAIGAALADPAIFQAVLPGWLAANARANPEAALAILPDRAATWEAVAGWWLGRGRVGRAVEAWQRRDRARVAEARLALARAAELIEGGAARRARGELAAVFALPPQRQSAVLFVEAARRLPGGAPDPALAPALERWLEWAVELAVHGRPALPADVLHRLGSAVEPILGAAATAVSGDVAGARSIARRTDPFRVSSDRRELLQLALASGLVAAGRGPEAELELAVLPRERRESPEAVRLARRARGPELVEPASFVLAAGDWRRRGPRWLLDLEVPASTALELGLDAQTGTVLEISIDGNTELVLVSGVRTLRRELPAEGGPVLVWLAVHRGGVKPPVGRLVLEPQ